MSEFSVSNLPQGAIQYLYTLRATIMLDPPYQRMSDIWNVDKRQLLVDSVINGYDIPKLYFHELVPTRKSGKDIIKYAIIDGKQRLKALWGFIEGTFTLADDFVYLHDPSINARGLSYSDLGKKYPLLKSRFDATSLSVVAVRTDDLELIEDMFSRLNEAVPLNAPEKRNAFGGTLPKAINSLSNHRFFTHKLPFQDKRYKHRDLATKFLLVEHKDAIVDTKKTYLDAFVKEWAENKYTIHQANQLKKSVESNLDNMCKIFLDNDTLLKSIGMTMLMFHFFRLLKSEGQISNIQRSNFEDFEAERLQNRSRAEENIADADYSLLEFDKFVQTPNDAYATRIRLKVITDFMIEHTRTLILPGDHSYFKL